jgi:glycerol-3-phosphate acyltransferase PlsX
MLKGGIFLLGKADVIVCDGFVGNIVLKFAESVLGVLKRKLRNYAMRNIFRRLTYFWFACAWLEESVEGV